MIRTVVVDDDYRVASIHAAYVGKVEGFEAIAEVHTAAAAVDAVIGLRPELLLLDLYLPDEHGLDLAARLRGSDYPPVDVIVITAAKDAVQRAGGHAAWGPALSAQAVQLPGAARQAALLRADALPAGWPARGRPAERGPGLRALRAPGQVAASKGRSDYTLETVEELLAGSAGDLSAAEIAERTGMSRATAQRYLTHLHDLGRVEIGLRYGVSGRPEHGYRWAPAR